MIKYILRNGNAIIRYTGGTVAVSGILGIFWHLTEVREEQRRQEGQINTLTTVVFSAKKSEEVVDILKSIDSNYRNLNEYVQHYCNAGELKGG